MSTVGSSARRAGVTIIDAHNSFIQCDACGRVWGANIRHGGHYHQGWRACPEGCNADRLSNGRRTPDGEAGER